MAIIFNGVEVAQNKMAALKERVAHLSHVPKLVSVVFREDAMGQLYTDLKAKAANQVGIDFEKVEVRRDDSMELILDTIREVCRQPHVTGMLIQKPNKFQYKNWNLDNATMSISDGVLEYEKWWEELTKAIDPKKDVDCLTSENLEKIYDGTSNFLPATARAVLEILDSHTSRRDLEVLEVAVVGRSDLVGKPLNAYLKNQKVHSTMLGSQDNLQVLQTADVIISATGKANLITGDMVKDGVIVIDVGEPKGDVDFVTVQLKASFITPVPGGVGPMTVVSLLSNMLELPVV